ncbi:MAG TPA: phytanoyl-CoA dioxygenase family protein [Sandaracinaceae bacterium LLY-WYZ-13_1]|nr:phytanoyl-CoA dioxygenase family protein [Sandaracinaceae bacterium LLY-WYZ-13_1]
MRVDAAVEQLRGRGFAVLPGLYDADRVARLRAALGDVYRDAGEPTPYRAEGVAWPAENVEISATGFVVHKLLGFTPALRHGLLAPDAVAVVRGALGDAMHLEMVGGAVTNHVRPFFRWHMHVGGIDDETYRRRGWRPTFARPQRVAMLVYLDEMGPGTGQLLVYPREPSDPIEPPFDVDARAWSGQVAVEGPAGTVVLLEQSTWHAVLPRTREAPLRMFVGFWFAAPWATEAERVDESLRGLGAVDEVLASVLPRA